jgi:hypothetical protein
LVTTPRRKIKAKPLVNDLRNRMGDRELMEKYTLSESQLHKVFQKLVDAGAIDEMELFMRTSLSDSTITKAFVENQCAVKEPDELEETTLSRDLETPSTITITERVGNLRKAISALVSKDKQTG